MSLTMFNGNRGRVISSIQQVKKYAIGRRSEMKTKSRNATSRGMNAIDHNKEDAQPSTFPKIISAEERMRA
eukprot:CAMPEP_0117436382 /NCGR_PEP_ID=MMETSP0759-20121206/978_1 /TAXON_ID=63605 /ORGANISM="Percolomonas cosmopolitus, Strain WS" /LENGTH=70 /DNA_ID=CAMNT_0005227979 /DNA_START=439 /DNA_END=651 /DNA_ORIENTATION=+